MTGDEDSRNCSSSSQLQHSLDIDVSVSQIVLRVKAWNDW